MEELKKRKRGDVLDLNALGHIKYELTKAFWWGESREGSDFWIRIYDRLIEMQEKGHTR